MTDDVVAELDDWLAEWRRLRERFGTSLAGTPAVDMAVIERARDEIVALREQLDRQPQGMDAIAHVRAEARAEALADCIRICPECANRIKALDTIGARHLRGG